jgi:hypothetical protein
MRSKDFQAERGDVTHDGPGGAYQGPASRGAPGDQYARPGVPSPAQAVNPKAAGHVTSVYDSRPVNASDFLETLLTDTSIVAPAFVNGGHNVWTLAHVTNTGFVIVIRRVEFWTEPQLVAINPSDCRLALFINNGTTTSYAPMGYFNTYELPFFSLVDEGQTSGIAIRDDSGMITTATPKLRCNIFGQLFAKSGVNLPFEIASS